MRHLILILALAACNGDAPEETEVSNENPTWHGDIAPIMANRCQKCHVAGGSAPFALDTYESTQRWASLALAKLVGDNQPPYYMPPWFAQDTEECAPPAPWRGDERLSPDQLALFTRWIENGTPEGDAATAAPAPVPAPIRLSDPQVLQPSTPMTISASADGDLYRCTPLDPQLTSEKWITGLQVLPGDKSIVHHVVIFSDPTSAGRSKADADGSYPCFGGGGNPNETVLFAWAPGSDPLEVPNNAGIPVSPGGGLVMQVHYHPSGTETSDLTQLEVEWTSTKPQYTAEMRVYGIVLEGDANSPNLVDPPFFVPAGVTDHRETYRQKLDVPQGVDVRMWSVFSHMHLAGSDIRVSLTHNNDEICLAQNNAWDFNWQRTYVYDAPFEQLPAILDQDTLEVRCTYNNTMDNAILAEALADEGLNAPVDFNAGEKTTDEMCLVILGIVY